MFLTRTLFPNDGPHYSVVSEVRWDCPPEKLQEAARIVEGAFRAAPPERIANELYRLRMKTCGREQRDAADQEAESVIWLEELRCYPGDIVIEVLRSWTGPGNPNGKWWPTWHEIAERLDRLNDRRKAILNLVRRMIERPEPVARISEHEPTPEERARAADHWHQTVRPELQAWREEIRAQAIKETPDQALERLAAQSNKPVIIEGEAVLKTIEQIKAAKSS